MLRSLHLSDLRRSQHTLPTFMKADMPTLSSTQPALAMESQSSQRQTFFALRLLRRIESKALQELLPEHLRKQMN